MRDVTYTVSSASITIGRSPTSRGPTRRRGCRTTRRTSSQPQLNLPENLIRWNGWSNSAPRPGTPLADDASSGLSGGTGSGPVQSARDHGDGRPPASLPRLRYGTEYALRARVVDIAGNVIGLTDPRRRRSATRLNRVTPAVAYGRFEPIGSPDVYTWNPNPLPGESLKRLVIRDIDSSPSSERAFAPNRIAEIVRRAPWRLRHRSGGALDPSAYSVITPGGIQRYPGTQTPSGFQVWDHDHADRRRCPYLPDPLARGGTLNVDARPTDRPELQFDFSPAAGQNWPNYQPYGIVLTPGAAQSVSTDATKRVLTFALTKGDTVVVQLSSYMNGTRPAQIRPRLVDLRVLRAGLAAQRPSATRSSPASAGRSRRGRPWSSSTPSRSRCSIPVFAYMYARQGARARRSRRSAGDITYSPKSTAHTDLLAEWGDPVDNGPGTGTPQGPGVPAPNDMPGARQSTVFTIPSSLEQQNSEQDRFLGRHEFFDTKHRYVSYYGQGDEPLHRALPGVQHLRRPRAGNGDGPGPPRTPRSRARGRFGHRDRQRRHGLRGEHRFTLDSIAGTITFTAAPAGPPVNSMVTVDVPAAGQRRDRRRLSLNILSSARPLSADIEFIVPIFKWSKISHHGSRILSGRTSAGLRVFLARPWWSSGIGELLGVVTDPASGGHQHPHGDPGSPTSCT